MGEDWDEMRAAASEVAATFRRGSALLATRARKWIKADLPLHGGGVLFAGYVAVLEVKDQPEGIFICIPAALGAWTLAAFVLAGSAPADGLDVDQLAEACHEIGSPHAHIQALADHLEVTPDEVRECCDEAGVTVAGGVRMQGRGVSTGIRAQDFPPLPSAEEEPEEEALTSENNSNNAIRREEREGMLIFYDEAEGRRYKVKKP